LIYDKGTWLSKSTFVLTDLGREEAERLEKEAALGAEKGDETSGARN